MYPGSVHVEACLDEASAPLPASLGVLARADDPAAPSSPARNMVMRRVLPGLVLAGALCLATAFLLDECQRALSGPGAVAATIVATMRTLPFPPLP